MRLSKIFTIVWITLALCCCACKDNLFDFDIHHIEADGEWGIPVFNGTISVDKLLQNLDSTSNVQVGEDGTVIFVIENEMENVVLLKDVLKIENKEFNSQDVINIPPVTEFDITQVMQFSLNTDEYTLKTCNIKSALFILDFSINDGELAYTADLTSNQILDADYNPLSIHFSNTQQHHVIDLSNYEIWPNILGNIQFTAHVVSPAAAGLSQISYNCHVTIQDFSIHSIVGKFQAISHELNTTTDINFDFDQLHLENVNLRNAKASIFVRNSICRVDGTINQLYLSGANGAYYPLIQSVLNFSIPVSPDQYTHVVDANIPALPYNSDYDSLGIHCQLTVNPDGFDAGDISLNENSGLDLKLKAELPANLSIKNAVYKDTIDNGLYQQLNSPIIQSIELLTLRIAYTSLLPFDLIPQIDFLNSSTGEVFHLNLNNFQIHGCYNGIPYQQQPIYIDIRDTDAQQVANSDKMILYFKLTTDDNTVEIKDSQYIQANIGAKVKYSNINL